MKYERVAGAYGLPRQREAERYWIASSQVAVTAGTFLQVVTHTIPVPGSATSLLIEKLYGYASINDGTNDFLASWFTIQLPQALSQVSILGGVADVPQTSPILYEGKIIELSSYEIALTGGTFFMDVLLSVNSFGPSFVLAPGQNITTTLGILVSEQ